MFRAFVLRYGLALAIVGALATGAWVSLVPVIKQQVLITSLLNASGQLRVLCQQVALHAVEFATPSANEQRTTAKERLAATATQLRRAHARLAQAGRMANLTPERARQLADVYDKGAASEVLGLNPQIETFLAAVDRLLGAPHESLSPTNSDLGLIVQAGSTGLLPKLDELVALFETQGQEGITFLHQLETIFWIATLAVLLLEAGLIFHPLAKRIRETLRKFEASNAALRESQDRFRDFGEAGSDWFWEMDSELRFTFLSKRFSELTAIAAEQVVGQTRIEIVDPEALELPRWVAHLADLEAHRPFRDFRYYLRQPTGAVRHFKVSGIPVFSDDGNFAGYRGTGSDVTQEVETRERMSVVESQLMDAVENLPDGFALWDREDRLILHNRQFDRTFPGLTEILRPGLAYRDLLQAAADQRLFDSGELPLEQFVAQSLSERTKDRSESEMRVSSGRWMRVSHSRSDSGRAVTIVQDITERKQAEDMVRRMALEDALTGLPNRIQFKEHLQRSLQARKRSEQVVGILLLDLDGFKEVNDTLGHPMGDALLMQVAERLQSKLREADQLARLGGDEFAIIANHAKSVDGVCFLAERILEVMAEPFGLEGQEVQSGTSIGITVAPFDRGNADELIKHADAALYQAKNQGRGCFRLFDAEMDQLIQNRRQMEAALPQALESGQISLHYQPQIALGSGRVCGVEALIRWNHPERGMIPPPEFIEIAEGNGFIIPLSEWILRRACRQLVTWREEGVAISRMGINISPIHLKRGNLPAFLSQVCQEEGIEPSALELELTEYTVMHGGSETVESLRRLQEIGVSLTIDDFGTGYSSLSYLKDYPVDRLKIDRSFIDAMLSDPGAAVITAAIIRLGHTLSLQVVAEGVETQEQFAAVAELGCDEAQGYLFSKPLPPDRLSEFYRTSLNDGCLERLAG